MGSHDLAPGSAVRAREFHRLHHRPCEARSASSHARAFARTASGRKACDRTRDDSLLPPRGHRPSDAANQLHERMDTTVPDSERTHASNGPGSGAAAVHSPARALHGSHPLRAAVSRLAPVALALVLAGSIPRVAQAGRITGTVFEDVNFGGGAGRDLFGSGGIRLTGAIVEAYDGTTGDFVNSSTTDSTGGYKINGVGSRLYVLRVVGASARSTRPGFISGTHLAVPTFHVDATFGTVVPVTTDVGGRQPAQPDAPAAGSGARINVSMYQFIA